MSTERAYSPQLSEAYDRRHFGGRSGQFILSKDTAALQALLPPAPGLVLDIPCGTGAYTAQLANLSYAIVAIDASAPMVQITAARQTNAAMGLAGIHDLPFASDSFDATVTLRLFSHFSRGEIAQALRELRRVIKPGGRMVFDSFRWTPRRLPVLRRFVAQSYIQEIAPDRMAALIAEAGLRVTATDVRYLFSPIWQRKLPYPALRTLTAVEATLPERWLLRTFWACTKDA
jgi:ubiquinone/menaquinone biosynthesis C-methylase UbiE